SDCDSAAIMLAGKNEVKGRATKLAAMALKSRVLTYAASDLHDVPTMKAKSAELAGFSNPEFLGYTSGERNARWTAALAASKAALDESNGGYKLNLTAPVTPEEGKLNYVSISMGGGSADKTLDASASSELIFAKYFIPNLSQDGRQ